jgi:hypothetical protein
MRSMVEGALASTHLRRHPNDRSSRFVNPARQFACGEESEQAALNQLELDVLRRRNSPHRQPVSVLSLFSSTNGPSFLAA